MFVDFEEAVPYPTSPAGKPISSSMPSARTCRVAAIQGAPAAAAMPIGVIDRRELLSSQNSPKMHTTDLIIVNVSPGYKPDSQESFIKVEYCA
jgi:hypothetical protein